MIETCILKFYCLSQVKCKRPFFIVCQGNFPIELLYTTYYQGFQREETLKLLWLLAAAILVLFRPVILLGFAFTYRQKAGKIHQFQTKNKKKNLQEYRMPIKFWFFLSAFQNNFVQIFWQQNNLIRRPLARRNQAPAGGPTLFELHGIGPDRVCVVM